MLSAELYLLWPMSFPLSGCSLEMYSSPQSLVSLGCFHTVDGRCIFDCPSVAREGLRLSSVSMAAPAMTNSSMDSDISASLTAAKLCFHPFEALEGELGAFFVLHKGCSLVSSFTKEVQLLSSSAEQGLHSSSVSFQAK